jgi:hypothetical protein
MTSFFASFSAACRSRNVSTNDAIHSGCCHVSAPNSTPAPSASVMNARFHVVMLASRSSPCCTVERDSGMLGRAPGGGASAPTRAR